MNGRSRAIIEQLVHTISDTKFKGKIELWAGDGEIRNWSYTVSGNAEDPVKLHGDLDLTEDGGLAIG